MVYNTLVLYVFFFMEFEFLHATVLNYCFCYDVEKSNSYLFYFSRLLKLYFYLLFLFTDAYH